MLKKHAAAVVFLLLPGTALAVGAGMHLLEAELDLEDRASLQRGAKLFANYCLSCHSVRFQRYNITARDLGLSTDQVEENLLFTTDKVQDRMTVAMTQEDAEKWFGVPPPDLSVVARARGADWLYSYLVTFYRDPAPSRPFGVNNVVFPEVGMPHVLWPLQGIQAYTPAEVDGKIASETATGLEAAGDSILVHKSVTLEDGSHVEATDRLEPSRSGSMQPGQYRRAARDIVNFLVYVGEPAKMVRFDIGFWVLAFLLVLIGLSYALYKEYWKDVH